MGHCVAGGTANAYSRYSAQNNGAAQRQFFLQIEHAFLELTVFRLQRRNTRHQLLNSGFAGSDHRVLGSELFRAVNFRW